MTLPPLKPVAKLAGYPLLDDKLAATASLLDVTRTRASS